MNILKQSPWGPKNTDEQPSVTEVFSSMQKKFTKFLGDNNLTNKNDKNEGPTLRTVLVIFSVLLFIWILSGIYIVQQDEQGLVLRMGRYARISMPGPNYHLPYPIETVVIEKVTRINRDELGFRSSDMGQRDDVPNESLMLTGDENIVDVNFIIQWRINNIKDYVLNIDNPHQTVRAVSESAIREVIGQSTLFEALTYGRALIEQKTKDLAQSILSNYKSGIDVVGLQLLKVDPPTTEVINAFRDVQNAEQDKERTINKAKSQRNKIIPEAEGQAARLVEAALGYEKQVIDIAQGEANRFLAIYKEYVNAEKLTHDRIYIETMESIMSKLNKLVIDPKATSSGILPYLPLKPLTTEGANDGK